MSSDRREQMLHKMREALDLLEQERKELDQDDAVLLQLQEEADAALEHEPLRHALITVLHNLTQTDQKLDRRVIQLEETMIRVIGDLIELHSIDQESRGEEPPVH